MAKFPSIQLSLRMRNYHKIIESDYLDSEWSDLELGQNFEYEKTEWDEDLCELTLNPSSEKPSERRLENSTETQASIKKVSGMLVRVDKVKS